MNAVDQQVVEVSSEASETPDETSDEEQPVEKQSQRRRSIFDRFSESIKEFLDNAE
jgi:hypothetical protein